MHPPCELVIRRLLPVLRAKVARILADKYNLTETQIARLLGTSQAAVSQYLSSRRAKAEGLSKTVLEEIERTAEQIALALLGRSREDPRALICELCRRLRSEGRLEELRSHRRTCVKA